MEGCRRDNIPAFVERCCWRTMRSPPGFGVAGIISRPSLSGPAAVRDRGAGAGCRRDNIPAFVERRRRRRARPWSRGCRRDNIPAFVERLCQPQRP